MIQKVLLTIFCVGVLSLVYSSWISKDIRVANDFPLISEEAAKALLNFPFTWSEKGSEGLGEHTTFTLWSWPLAFSIGLLANLGLEFWFIERLQLIIFLFIPSVIGIWLLGMRFNLSFPAKLVFLTTYLANSYILLLIDGGQMVIAFAYGLFPLAYFMVTRAINANLLTMLLAGISTAILGFFDVRFVYVLFILLVVHLIYQLLTTRRATLSLLYSWIKVGFIIGVVFIAIHSYWLWPLIKAPLSSTVFTSFTKLSDAPLSSLGHAFLLLAPHWPQNIFGKITPLRVEFAFLPILAVLPLLLRSAKGGGLWILVALIGVVLAKGTAAPFGEFYNWCYTYIPGFSLFRDSSKFYFLIALSYGVLIARSSDLLATYFKKNSLGLAVPVIIMTYIAYLAAPTYLNQMTGTFSSARDKESHLQAAQLLRGDDNYSRVMWVPNLRPMSFTSPQHPSIEASRLLNKRPFLIGTTSTYETLNYLREEKFIGELFDVSGVGYLAYPHLDLRRDDTHPDNIKYYDTFLDQLSHSVWVKSVISPKPAALIQTRDHQDRFFMAPNTWMVVGSDDIYNESTKSAQKKLSKNALVFVEESPEVINKIDQFSESRVLLNKKDRLDLEAAFISKSDFIPLAQDFRTEPDATGWWKRSTKDFLWFRDFLHKKYQIDNQDFDFGLGWLIGEGEKTLNLKTRPGLSGVLLARVMVNSKGGEIAFYQEDGLLGTIKTIDPDLPQTNTKTSGYKEIPDRIDQYDQGRYKWFEVGMLKQGVPLTIKIEGQLNIINTLALVDQSDWQAIKNKVEVMINNGQVVTEYMPTIRRTEGTVSYEQINPTRYKVLVKGLSSPELLVFSQTFDPLWQLSGQSPLPVYSLLNGFMVSKDGEYTLEFLAQRYLNQGLWIAGASILIIISGILYLSFRGFKKA